MKIEISKRERKQLLKALGYMTGLDPEGTSRGLVQIYEEDGVLDKLHDKLLG